MTVKELEAFEDFKIKNQGDSMGGNITKVFCCDLLSIAMGRAPAGGAWITVMANMNTLAVAALADVSCLILAEGTKFDEICLEKAKQQNITVFYSELPVFEAALAVHRHLE